MQKWWQSTKLKMVEKYQATRQESKTDRKEPGRKVCNIAAKNQVKKFEKT